jgi:ectoine hydroxylase-related dioxygenase (phytanoyl-CoA dioxygenase family)
VSEAYLGPAYRITTQLNVVKPGGKPQVSHRDYHLGFQTREDVARWPKPMHDASRLLTLQGAVAHSDMPLESGPTRLLPFSQGFEAGFMAYRLEEFDAFFLENYVALPLEKGDAVFFSPALFHAAGENQTKEFERSANLIQVSSAFGKPMESVDPVALVDKAWELIAGKFAREGMSREVEALVAAVAEGYPFPTNLDRRPPAPGGMAPESEQDVLRRGLSEGWGKEKVLEELTAMRKAGSA